MKNTILLIIIILLFNYISCSKNPAKTEETSTIKGQIIRYVNNEKQYVQNAIVQIDMNESLQDITNENGEFEILNVQLGEHDI